MAQAGVPQGAVEKKTFRATLNNGMSRVIRGTESDIRLAKFLGYIKDDPSEVSVSPVEQFRAISVAALLTFGGAKVSIAQTSIQLH